MKEPNGFTVALGNGRRIEIIGEFGQEKVVEMEEGARNEFVWLRLFQILQASS